MREFHSLGVFYFYFFGAQDLQWNTIFIKEVFLTQIHPDQGTTSIRTATLRSIITAELSLLSLATLHYSNGDYKEEL